MSHLILVVDDSTANRLMMRDILIYHGYDVLEAQTGEEGIQLVLEAKPEIVLMDIQMPVMDGVTATAKLRQNPDIGDLKIIAITSMAMKGDREKILAAGFDDYVAKPINTRELPLLINKHLSTG
ncbi:MAG: response regulator [Desulfuromonas sp.]|nr:response regulator [Desulfuromonas sp.]